MWVQAGGVIDDGSYVLNGRGHGPLGEVMGGSDVRWDSGLRRPFIEDDPTHPLRGQACVTVNTGRKRWDAKERKYFDIYRNVPIRALQERGVNSPVFNASLLTKGAWIQLDQAVIRATRQRLSAWADLASSFTYGGFNAMGKMTLEYQSMSDPGEAVVDMDARTPGRTDRPLFDIKSLPLPITHSDFSFSQREIMVSRSGGMPLDTTMAEAAGRRIAETVEQTLIGTVTGVTYGTQTTGFGTHTGTSTVYGYTNFPYRVTKTDLTTPTGSNPNAVVQDIIEMRETMRSNGFYGPYRVYHSTAYDTFLDSDYVFTNGSNYAVNPTMTLRERIARLPDIQDFKRLDYLTSGYQIVMVQWSREVVEAVNGMDITTLQWQTLGGLEENYKVLCVWVPRLKSPYSGTSGIIHGTTS